MAKKDKQKGILFLIAGAIVIMYMMGFSDIGRAAGQLQYDGDNSLFSIDVENMVDTAEEGDLFTMDLRVTNEESTEETMYVQCSILDEEQHSFLEDVQLQATVYMPQDANCVANEPFTQTAKVTLSGSGSEIVSFTALVPEDDKPGKDTHVLFCAAFEQCYQQSPFQDPFTSASFKRTFNIEQDDDDDSNNNYVEPGDSCDVKTDCAGWLLGAVNCVNGHCVDDEDTPDEPFGLNIEWPSSTDTAIKSWAKDNQIILFGAGFLMLINGGIMVYGGSKRRVPTYQG